MNKKYSVNIKFADGVCNFYNVSEADSKVFNLWMSGESENSIMKFTYKDNTYFLNREQFCYGAINEDKGESLKNKKKRWFRK